MTWSPSIEAEARLIGVVGGSNLMGGLIWDPGRLRAPGTLRRSTGAGGAFRRGVVLRVRHPELQVTRSG